MASAISPLAQGAVTAKAPHAHLHTAAPGRPRRATPRTAGPIRELCSPTRATAGAAGSDVLFQRAGDAVAPGSNAGSVGSPRGRDAVTGQVAPAVHQRRPDLELLRKRHKQKLLLLQQQQQQANQAQTPQQQQHRPIEHGVSSPRPGSGQRQSQDLSPRPPPPRSRPHSQPVGCRSPRLGGRASPLRRPESARPQRPHADSPLTRDRRSASGASTGGKATRGPNMEDVRRAIFFDKSRGKIFKISAAEGSNAGRIGVLIRLQRAEASRLTSIGRQNGGLVMRFHDAKHPTLLVVANASFLELVEGIAPPSKKPSPRLLVRHRTSTPVSNPTSQPHSFITPPPDPSKVCHQLYFQICSKRQSRCLPNLRCS
eukprot:INCI13475.2.p1 GENE.INCI13475.2~~INCI13475.2.p1  ORF type:complete len:370 (-),score=30.33 INCI13475.2:16-1125(-)